MRYLLFFPFISCFGRGHAKGSQFSLFWYMSVDSNTIYMPMTQKFKISAKILPVSFQTLVSSCLLTSFWMSYGIPNATLSKASLKTAPTPICFLAKVCCLSRENGNLGDLLVTFLSTSAIHLPSSLKSIHASPLSSPQSKLPSNTMKANYCFSPPTCFLATHYSL